MCAKPIHYIRLWPRWHVIEYISFSFTLPAWALRTPPHSSGETETGIPPEPTPPKKRRSARCQGRAAGPQPRAAAGEHGEDLPLDSIRARSCYAPRRLRDVRGQGPPSRQRTQRSGVGCSRPPACPRAYSEKQGAPARRSLRRLMPCRTASTASAGNTPFHRLSARKRARGHSTGGRKECIRGHPVRPSAERLESGRSEVPGKIIHISAGARRQVA